MLCPPRPLPGGGALLAILFSRAMPPTPHIESHFTATETVRDVVSGMSDGLTVPFALAAGLSGAVASTKLVVIAGLLMTALRGRRLIDHDLMTSDGDSAPSV